MAAEPPSLRALLRSQRVFPDGMPEFDPDEVPDDPVTLFLRWLEAALKDAVPAPHTMTLATADEVEFWQGDPDRRHVRLRYRRAGSGSGWVRQLLWP